MITLYYGPGREKKLGGRVLDHPFARKMPSEVPLEIDSMLSSVCCKDVEVVLVEELPSIYLRYLIRKGELSASSVSLMWVEADGQTRLLRLGDRGELLDPWPTGSFGPELDFVFGGW